MINEVNNMILRFKTKNEQLPTIKEGESVYDFINKNNGGDVIVYGSIGRGDKTHKLLASYIVHNNEKVIMYYHSICGSESYKSLSVANIDANTCDCKKCLKK